MCCTGKLRLNPFLSEVNICCRLHLVALLCLILVAILLSAHFLVDAAGLSATMLMDLHLHGGFPLPPLIVILTAFIWILPIVIRHAGLNSWHEPPTTPPPLSAQ